MLLLSAVIRYGPFYCRSRQSKPIKAAISCVVERKPPIIVRAAASIWILLPTRTLFCCCRRLAGRLRLAANLLDTESLLHTSKGAFRSVRCEVFGEFCPFPRSRSSQTSQWARRPGKSGAPAELFCESQATIECAPSLILAVALYRTCQTIRCADHKFHCFIPLTFFAVVKERKDLRSTTIDRYIIWKKSNTSRADFQRLIHRLLSRARVTEQILDRRAHHKPPSSQDFWEQA